MEEANMKKALKEFQHLKIKLEVIKSAVNFDKQKPIGVGGFGEVYEAELPLSKGLTKVAIKRLDPDRKHGQGKVEFLKEIQVLSRYKHENIIKLLGFCYEGKDVMILVYEYASNSSLDRHLESPELTWALRLKICLDAAKGLSYLHDPRGKYERIFHRDIKSPNILLDKDWNAKVADLGLSLQAPANQQHSTVLANAAGTTGYRDPHYEMTQNLTKESDVFSFGVVLFEVLCGKICITYTGKQVKEYFVPTWIKNYKEKNLNDIIFKHPKIDKPLHQTALEAFSDIAYRCLENSPEDRPKMADVVTQLEIALDNQEISEGRLFFDYEAIVKCAEPPLNYRSQGELNHLLTKGVLLNGGKTWFSVYEKKVHCEMISFVECFDSAPIDSFYDFQIKEYKSRFPRGPYKYSKERMRIKAHIKTQFLTPGITYAVNFVFKATPMPISEELLQKISLKYKLPNETKPSISYLAHVREDGWLMCELYQFTSDRKTFDLEIMFDGFEQVNYMTSTIAVEGIEFRPLEKEEHKDEEQTVIDSDANWEEKLPTDYEDIIKRSTNNVPWTTKKEAYSVMSKGFLIDDGQKWFSVNKNGKKCHMVSARAALSSRNSPVLKMFSLPESRFGEAFQCLIRYIFIDAEIQSQLLSSQTTYASYLVYKLPNDQSGFEAPGLVEDEENSGFGNKYFYFVSPQTPVIRPKVDQKTHNPLNGLKKKGFPRQRSDGWMEVQIWEFSTATTTEMIPMHLRLWDESISKGVVFEGIEFRPI